MKLTKLEKYEARHEKRVALLLRLLNDPRVVATIQGIVRRKEELLVRPQVYPTIRPATPYPATPNPYTRPMLICSTNEQPETD